MLLQILQLNPYMRCPSVLNFDALIDVWAPEYLQVFVYTGRQINRSIHYYRLLQQHIYNELLEKIFSQIGIR